MSVVKINVIEVPDGMGPEIEKRFAARAHAVETMPGFEGFELLRPVAGDTRYFVYTRWADDASFQAWLGSDNFRSGHAGGDAAGAAPQRPVGAGATLLEFEVVDLPPATA